MSYAGISVKAVLGKINARYNGWYLPQVQRQYVWGARHESEEYVCLLLDSLLKRYPIGGIVLWETEQRIPYRKFIDDYAPGNFAHQVDEGLWDAPKALVYDGQQRLQTLYSVLLHHFNGRVLHYDLLFNPAQAESDETGFHFRDASASPDPRYIRMTEVASMSETASKEIELKAKAALAAPASDNEKQLLILENVTALWAVFVRSEHSAIAYFSVKAETAKEVNEVFRRLNTGGIALTQLELVLGKIKAIQSDYEEKLWEVSEKIKTQSGGIDFSSSEILQFFHLLVKTTVRIDESRLDGNDIKAFQMALTTDSEALIELFSGYLSGLFSINHASIVPRWLAVLPIAAYLAELKRNGHEWRIRAMETKQIDQYFLLSQFCDWNTQTMVNAFAREAVAEAKLGNPFPLEKIRQIALEKNRTGVLHEYQLLSQAWFATKVLTPNRSYIFHDSKPQVDHIFPVNLSGRDEAYKEAVDILWNYQPMPAEVNNYKRARHPKEFFNSVDGNKYWDKYDFIPQASDALWDDHLAFLADRKQKMLSCLDTRYGLKPIMQVNNESAIPSNESAVLAT